MALARGWPTYAKKVQRLEWNQVLKLLDHERYGLLVRGQYRYHEIRDPRRVRCEGIVACRPQQNAGHQQCSWHSMHTRRVRTAEATLTYAQSSTSSRTNKEDGILGLDARGEQLRLPLRDTLD